MGLIKIGGDNNPYDDNFVELDTRYADLNSAIKSLQSRFGINNIAFNKNRYYLTGVGDGILTLESEDETREEDYEISSLVDGEVYIVSLDNPRDGIVTEGTDPLDLKLTDNDLVVKFTKEINGIYQPYLMVIQNVVGFGYVPKEITQNASGANVVFEKVFASSMKAQQNEYTFSLNSLIGPALIQEVTYTKDRLISRFDDGYGYFEIELEQESYDGINYEDVSHVVECFCTTSGGYSKKIEINYSLGSTNTLLFEIDKYYIENFMEDGSSLIVRYKRFLTPEVTLS